MPKILIADDESNILMLLEIMFKDLDAEVITAENGEIALEKAQKFKPDLVITDVVMPKKNGFEVCRGIRNNPEIADTPIIILSALGDEYNKITGFEEGADDYVTKPFNVEELKARSKALLLRHQSRTQKQPSANAIPEPASIQLEHISTGIKDLDDHLYGGLPKGSNILILGPLGIGKSSFSRRFIRQGLLNEERCLYVALDDDPKKIRKSMSSHLGKPISDYEDLDLIRFVDAYSWSGATQPDNEKFSVTGVLELNQLSGIVSDASYELGQTIQSKLGGRRVIDSISSLLVNFELPAAQRFLSQISRTAVAFGGVTTLFVMEEGTVPDQVLNNIKYIMDGVIEFKEVDGKRTVKVASMKWSRHKSSLVYL